MHASETTAISSQRTRKMPTLMNRWAQCNERGREAPIRPPPKTTTMTTTMMTVTLTTMMMTMTRNALATTQTTAEAK